ncbi:hypothetical protein [Devosia sp. Naph2]|uniref:hypothetical protein n=1 Tax=Devosia polycyclovorans TaxID=3345148 RepID=UPI0035D0E429
MTTYLGNSGVLKVGAGPTAVAELTGFTITETSGTVEDTAQGDTAQTHKPNGLPTWTGSMRGHYFPEDTNGQAVLVAGAELGFEGSPTGTANGRQKLTGTIIVTSIEIGSDNGAVVPFTCQFQGTGALARGTHSA